MKNFITLILLVFPLMGFSQSAMLFPDYIPATIILKGNKRVNVPVNYNATKHLMMYKQGDDDMILGNIQTVDSVLVGKHRFIPIKNRFFEVIPVKSEFLLVDWNVSMTNIGYKGAYGQVTHSKVHNYNVSAMTHDIYHTEAKPNTSSLEVYRRSNRNTYYILRNQKLQKFKDKKSLLKLFPERTEEIEGILKDKKTMFTNVEDVVDLMKQIL